MTGLKDISKFSRISGKTIGIYICTTVVAILIGLAMGLLVQPGKLVNHEQVAHLQEHYHTVAEEKKIAAKQNREQGSLAFLTDIIPNNIIKATSDNGKMLQIIFFAVLFGLATLAYPVTNHCHSFHRTSFRDRSEFLPTLYHRCYDRTFFYRYPGYPRRQLCHPGNGAHFRRYSGRRSGIDIGGGPTIGHAAHRSKCNRRCSGMFHY